MNIKNINVKINPKIKDKIYNNIILDNENFIAINKPYGISVHNGTKSEINIIDIIKNNSPNYIELCHRLDKNTSGCIIIAKNPVFLKKFQKLINENKIKKEYHALVKGIPKIKKIDIISKNILNKYNKKINDKEKISKTKIYLLKNFDNLSLLKINTYTGRLHQIRIHLAHIGHPIINDEKYGNKSFNNKIKSLNFNRMFLHAKTLIFDCPITQKKIIINADYDENIKNFFTKIKDKKNDD